MTPEKLFFRYAFPCTEFRWQSGKITEDQKRRIFQIVDNDIEPDRSLLTVCFPDAYKAMYLLAQHNSRNVWDINNVQDYWRDNHFGPSPVDKLEVLNRHTEVGFFLKTRLDGRKDGVMYINIFNLQLLVGDVVYTHQRCIIERA